MAISNISYYNESGDKVDTFKNSNEPLTNERKTILENENGALDNEAFLKLLLIELQNQDPTEPMDSAQILTQTSQLATLEAQNSTTEAMKAISSQFTTNTALSSISAIGKRAVLADPNIKLDSSGGIDFDIEFTAEAKTGTIEIFDSNNNKIIELDIENLPRGVNTFSWDGQNQSGARAAEGGYRAVANYTDGKSGNFSDSYGTYTVQSVRFDGGVAALKLGDNYVSLTNIGEIKP